MPDRPDLPDPYRALRRQERIVQRELARLRRSWRPASTAPPRAGDDRLPEGLPATDAGPAATPEPPLARGPDARMWSSGTGAGR